VIALATPFVGLGADARLLAQETPGSKSPVFLVGFLGDSKHLLTASLDGYDIWDLANGRKLRSFGKPEKPRPIQDRTTALGALSPDGKAFAVFENDRPIRIWDTAAGKETRAIAIEQSDRKAPLLAVSMAFSPNGKTLAVRGQDQVIHVFSVENGERLRLFGKPIGIKPFRPGFFAYGVPCDDSVAFAPNGKSLVGVAVEVDQGRQKGFVRWYDAASGELTRDVPIEQPNPFVDVRTGFGIACLAFSSDGNAKLAWASSDGTARLFDAESGKELRRLPAIQSGVHAAFVFSADRRLLAYRASNDPQVRLIDLGGKSSTAVRQEELNRANPQPSCRTFAFSPDNQLLAEGLLGNRPTFWDIR
jgi:WD40 repeat protein